MTTPTGKTETYRGYKLAELTNGWWRTIGASSNNQEPSLAEMKAYIDQMERGRERLNKGGDADLEAELGDRQRARDAAPAGAKPTSIFGDDQPRASNGEFGAGSGKRGLTESQAAGREAQRKIDAERASPDYASRRVGIQKAFGMKHSGDGRYGGRASDKAGARDVAHIGKDDSLSSIKEKLLANIGKSTLIRFPDGREGLIHNVGKEWIERASISDLQRIAVY